MCGCVNSMDEDTTPHQLLVLVLVLVLVKLKQGEEEISLLSSTTTEESE